MSSLAPGAAATKDWKASARGGRNPERCRHRRLPDPALAGDVDEALVEQARFHQVVQRMTDPSLSASYETCRRLHRRHDPTYYWATRRLPREVRPATHALYGYVRTADEIVDGPDRPPTPAARRAALDAWEQELRDGRSSHPAVIALVDAAE